MIGRSRAVKRARVPCGDDGLPRDAALEVADERLDDLRPESRARPSGRVDALAVVLDRDDDHRLTPVVGQPLDADPDLSPGGAETVLDGVLDELAHDHRERRRVLGPQAPERALRDGVDRGPVGRHLDDGTEPALCDRVEVDGLVEALAQLVVDHGDRPDATLGLGERGLAPRRRAGAAPAGAAGRPPTGGCS